MGGFARPLVDAVARLGDKDFRKAATDLVSSMGRTFKSDPRLGPVEKMLQEGVYQRNKIGISLLAPIHGFEAEVRKDPQLAKAHDYKTAPLAQIHNSLPNNHPAKNSLVSLMADASNHSKTIPQLELEGMAKANTYGREVAFGPDGINLAATLYPMLKSNAPPLDKTKAEAALGVLSMVFRDNESIKQGVEQSGIKADVQKYMTRQLKAYGGQTYNAAGKAKLFPMDVTAEYKKGGKVEGVAHNYAMTYLAPGIAVAHLADFFKLPATVPARALWETFMGHSSPQLDQLKASSGIFFHTMHSIYHNDFEYRMGVVSKMTGSPDAGALINKMFHQPLFNNERMLQLSIFGSAGYHSAQMWAQQAMRGDQGAISALKDLNLDPAVIAQRGGTLTDEELKSAIYHFVNNRLFIDKPLSRSKLAQSSPFFRVATMFHGYITREGRLITHELSRMYKAKDYMGLAQMVGTIGIVFPLAAPLIESLGVLLRTGSPTQAGQRVEDDYSNLMGQKGFKNFIEQYLELIAHFGGAGVFMNYLHAAENHKTAAALIGPTPGVVAGLADDVGTSIRTSKTTGEHNFKPLERDMLHYATIPILGSWAAQQIPKGRQSSGISSHLRRRGRRH